MPRNDAEDPFYALAAAFSRDDLAHPCRQGMKSHAPSARMAWVSITRYRRRDDARAKGMNPRPPWLLFDRQGWTVWNQLGLEKVTDRGISAVRGPAAGMSVCSQAVIPAKVSEGEYPWLPLARKSIARRLACALQQWNGPANRDDPRDLPPVEAWCRNGESRVECGEPWSTIHVQDRGYQ